MSDTNSRITIRLEDGTPPVPGPPPVPPSVGPVTPPDTLGGTPSPGSSAPEAPVPPLPSTGSVPGPAPGSVIPNMPIEEPVTSESVDASTTVSENVSEPEVDSTKEFFTQFRTSLVVATTAVFSLVEAVQALDSAFQEMAERGGEYDAGIAQANAVADLRLTLAEMRRANYLSTELAQYMDERSQLSVEIKDAITELSKGLLPLATETVQLLRPSVRLGTKVIRFFSSFDDNLKKLQIAMGAFAANPILAQGLAVNYAILKILEHIDSLMPDPAKEDFSNFRRDLEDFLNPATSRVNVERELAAAMALPDRDRVFPAFRP